MNINDPTWILEDLESCNQSLVTNLQTHKCLDLSIRLQVVAPSYSLWWFTTFKCPMNMRPQL
jgi:hypothetical protein